MKKKNTKEPQKPKVHEDLQGFELSVDQFGEIRSNIQIDKINQFLDKNVEDKKLINRKGKQSAKKKKK